MSMGAVLSMPKHRPGRGRRQDVQRDAEGRIASSEYRREDIRTLASWNRLRDVAQEIGLDPRLATQLGRMFYMHQLTSAQLDAGQRWAAMLQDYDRIKLGKSRTPASPSFEARSPGEPSSVLSDKDAAFLQNFEKAHQALCAGGMLVENAVNRLCRGEGIGANLPQAIAGLDRLAAHFGLTGPKRRINAD